ncbi:MAG TPA: thioredoxin domain-containing protein [Acidobacteriaceae bacterium]
MSPDLSRRIEVLIRGRSDIPAEYTIVIGDPTKSDVSGYDMVNVSFAADGKPAKSIPFLLSADGKTLAQMNKFDLSQDPKDKISAAGRPARGGPPNAPVLIVGFDDLECPYCAIMNAELFPAVLNRYKDQVRVVYRDLPLDELHPWARHAAVDANCLATASTDGYWNFVDYVHAHASTMADPEKTAAKANQALDKIALDEGGKQKVNQAELTACLLKQDDANVKSSVSQAAADLRLESTPVLYVNGEKVEGVVPIETLYRIIDRALVAAGQTPPPPPAPAAPATSATPAPPTKPGS